MEAMQKYYEDRLAAMQATIADLTQQRDRILQVGPDLGHVVVPLQPFGAADSHTPHPHPHPHPTPTTPPSFTFVHVHVRTCVRWGAQDLTAAEEHKHTTVGLAAHTDLVERLESTERQLQDMRGRHSDLERIADVKAKMSVEVRAGINVARAHAHARFARRVQTHPALVFRRPRRPAVCLALHCSHPLCRKPTPCVGTL
jgi:hypothetical protein